MASYRFFQDSSHGWLEVPRSEVEASGIDVSPYSYYDPETGIAYLEEDEDMINFMKASDLARENIIDQPVSIGVSGIRTLPPYKQAR